jgi:hypothetical protein
MPCAAKNVRFWGYSGHRLPSACARESLSNFISAKRVLKSFRVTSFREAPTYKVLVVTPLAATPSVFKSALAMEFVHGVKPCAKAIWRHCQLNNVRMVAFVLGDRSFAFTLGQG